MISRSIVGGVAVAFWLTACTQAAAQQYMIGDRILVLPETSTPATDASVRISAFVNGGVELVREIRLADWPLADDDCQFGDCSEAVRPDLCGGRCLRGAPDLLFLDRVSRRAVLTAELSDLRAIRPLVLFLVVLETGQIQRLGRVEASVLTDVTMSPNGRFLSFIERSRGGPDWSLDFIDLQTAVLHSDAAVFNGRVDLATEYRRATATAWQADQTLVINADIGSRDRVADPRAGVGAIRRRLRIVFDPIASQVVSATPLP
jgi:hypothetical protein